MGVAAYPFQDLRVSRLETGPTFMPRDPETLAHLEWLGYVQPVGLVVSPPALLAAQAHINRNIIPDHRRFLECVDEVVIDAGQMDRRDACPHRPPTTVHGRIRLG